MAGATNSDRVRISLASTLTAPDYAHSECNPAPNYLMRYEASELVLDAAQWAEYECAAAAAPQNAYQRDAPGARVDRRAAVARVHCRADERLAELHDLRALDAGVDAGVRDFAG